MKKDDKTNVIKCPYCGYKPPKEVYKEHLKLCDENPKSENYKELKGLGGWLILIQISLWIGIIAYFFYFIEFLLDFQNILFIIFFLVLFILTGYTLFLMYLYDKKFPLFAIIWLWLPFLSPLIGFIILFFSMITGLTTAYELGIFIGGFMLSIIPSIIWTEYFRKSKRIKNTFVK